MAQAQVARLGDDGPDDDIEVITPEPLESEHVLVLGEERFECGDELPIGTLIRYADNDVLQYHNILTRLVDPEDHDRMWDAFEQLDTGDMFKALGDLVASYSERPTTRPSRSSGGSKRTRRK